MGYPPTFPGGMLPRLKPGHSSPLSFTGNREDVGGSWTFWVRPVSPGVLRSGNVVAALAESLDKPFPQAVGFLFGNTELSLELWNIIAGISGFDDLGGGGAA